MRHVVEVKLVEEGSSSMWASRIAKGRRERGLPLPSVELITHYKNDATDSANSTSGNSSTCNDTLKRSMRIKRVKPLCGHNCDDTMMFWVALKLELVRKVVSFI